MRLTKIAWAYSALLVSSTFVLLLINRQNTLEGQYKQLLGLSEGPLQGRWYPVIAGTDLSGDSVCIGNRGDEPQFVFFFSSSCSFCAEALARWKPVLDSLLRSNSIRAVGVALDSDSSKVAAFVDAYAPPVPVVQLSHPRWRDVFRVRSVPMMVVLDHDGRVRGSRGGVPSDALIQDSILLRLDSISPRDPPLPRSAGCVEH